MYGKSNMETYISIWKIDSPREIAVWLRNSNRGSVSTLRDGWGGSFKREGIYVCMPMTDSGWMQGEMGWSFKREGIYVCLWLTHAEV